MPYDMAMNDEISRIQFYKRAQSILDELEKLETLVNSNLDKVGLTQEDFQTATELLACFNAWEPDVKVVGNVRAEDAAALIFKIISIHHEQIDYVQRVVCAANRCADGVVLLGARHWDMMMHKQADQIYGDREIPKPVEQGFIDNRGNFLTREEAWKIAEANGQIIRRVGGDSMNGGKLFSENLY